MLWLLALAGQLSLPAPLNLPLPDVRAIFSADDFPAYLQREGTSRTVYTRTTVRPDGTLESCAAEATSGDSKLDAYTCALIVKRAKFLPAKWTDGTPVYGVIRTQVRWFIGNGPPFEEEQLRATVPDLELSVNQLPKGAHSIAALELEIAADETGRPVTCAEYPAPAKWDPKHYFPELVPVACQQVMASLLVRPPVDESGKRVRSVQSVQVQFKVKHDD
jgi:hypothetical protein